MHQYGYVLVANDMRSSNFEMVEVVCWAETEQELRDFLDAEKVETYTESSGITRPNPVGVNLPRKWCKTFRQGGPLEWFNDPRDCVKSGGVVPFYLPPRLSELKS
jgi:hypothetical protein